MGGEISYASKPWLKSYDKGVPEKINYEEICMPDAATKVLWSNKCAGKLVSKAQL